MSCDQIGCHTKEEAEAWRASIVATVAAITPRGPPPSLTHAPRRRTESDVPTHAAPGNDANSDGGASPQAHATWCELKHVDGVRIFVEGTHTHTHMHGHTEGRDGGEGEREEEAARMISCVISGDPTTVFTQLWDFEKFATFRVASAYGGAGQNSHAGMAFMRVAKEVDDHRRILHLQYP